ncbi:MAG: hypothetical protein JWQ02_392, partial [Capsulimonas sp.]|nr:hypothetical protein [Capsulimonas sp.]
MYLKEILLQNVGPLKLLDVEPSFNPDGNPKPLIIVGQNGTGKTIVLSYIVDALMEFSKTAFVDMVLPGPGVQTPYFKVTGSTMQRSDSGCSIGLLRFGSNEKNAYYVDKTGNLSAEEFKVFLEGRFSPVTSWPVDKIHKNIHADKELIESVFNNSAICYFPASRHEHPHWLNQDSITNISIYSSLKPKYQGQLKKPLVVESSVNENKQWLLDIILDSRVDVIRNPDGSYSAPGMFASHTENTQSLNNINRLLTSVLGNNRAWLTVGPRNSGLYRLCISQENGIVLPSLDHLSSGQSILFNLFVTIIRYAERNNLSKSWSLNEIEGIVIVDEIDAHLHSDLQYQVLPMLIKLFPKVQFIMTSHAPLFLLGMEREFG